MPPKVFEGFGYEKTPLRLALEKGLEFSCDMTYTIDGVFYLASGQDFVVIAS